MPTIWTDEYGSTCGCGHSWAEHTKTPNGAMACKHHGCGCCDVEEPAPYPFCRNRHKHPNPCAGKGYCPEEYACND